jgi:hypothetical protein
MCVGHTSKGVCRSSRDTALGKNYFANAPTLDPEIPDLGPRIQTARHLLPLYLKLQRIRLAG